MKGLSTSVIEYDVLGTLGEHGAFVDRTNRRVEVSKVHACSLEYLRGPGRPLRPDYFGSVTREIRSSFALGGSRLENVEEESLDLFQFKAPRGRSLRDLPY